MYIHVNIIYVTDKYQLDIVLASIRHHVVA